MKRTVVLLSSLCAAISFHAVPVLAQGASTPKPQSKAPPELRIAMEPRWVTIEDVSLPDAITLPKPGEIAALSLQQLDSLLRVVRAKGGRDFATQNVVVPIGKEEELTKAGSFRVAVRPDLANERETIRLNLKIQDRHPSQSLAPQRSPAAIRATLGTPLMLHVQTIAEAITPPLWQRLLRVPYSAHKQHVLLIVTPTMATEEQLVTAHEIGRANVK